LRAKPTRRQFLKTATTGAAGLTLMSLPGCQSTLKISSSTSTTQRSEVLEFRSAPELRPPAVEVSTPARETEDGYIFVAPKKGEAQFGPMILDDSGELVWFKPLPEGDRATDLKVQTYRGEPVLTWWEGQVARSPWWKARASRGYGKGEYVILDSTYREVARVRAKNGYEGDLHEFLITESDTVLVAIYGTERRDLSSLGGSERGEVLYGVVQELDIATGELLFEWNSLDHVELEETYDILEGPGDYLDYFHINSIDVDHDGDLILCARKTFAVYKIARHSGEVIWRLGGKKSDFEMGEGTRTRYPHDARRQEDGTITIFDNGDTEVDKESRVIALELDEENMRASLAKEYTHPDSILSDTQANAQVLPGGNVFVGWGSEPEFSEFSAEGQLLFSAKLRDGGHSYRAFRFRWTGRPDSKPAIAAERAEGEEVTVYASYNGATEVVEWQILTGPDPGQLEPASTAAKEGFETAITMRIPEPYVSVRASDRSGRALGDSEAVEIR
jgi:hypothetical protein